MENPNLTKAVESLNEFKTTELKKLASHKGKGKAALIKAYNKSMHEKIDQVAEDFGLDKHAIIGKMLQLAK